MADTAASSPQPGTPDSSSRPTSPYPYSQRQPESQVASMQAPRRTISDRSMDDAASIEARSSTSLAPAASYREPPASPSSTSQSDDGQDDGRDFADLAEIDEDKLIARRARLLRESSAARLSRRGTLIPASQTSPSGSSSGLFGGSEVASASNLPHEILLHIFKYVVAFPPDLLSCLQVCKAWCICGVELLWHRPSFYKISSLFRLIHVIKAPGQLFPYADFVRRLNFTILASQLEDKLFVRMSACTRLERLTLAGCCHILDDTLITVFQNTKQLVALDLTDVINLTDATLLTLARNCHRLQGINLTGCKKITSAGVVELAKNCKLLRRVKLCGCEQVGDDALIALADHCPVLLEVDVINCHNITDRSVREIWKKSFHMRELRLAHCGILTDDAFPSSRGTKAVPMLGTNQNMALRASVGPVSYHASESAPASRGSSPARFGSNGAENGGDHGSPHHTSTPPTGLSTPITPQRLFDHLRILDLTGCSSITDDTVEGIVTNVPRIKNLILTKCTRLTDESIYSISRLGKNLHYLHLGHVSNIKDRAVTHLARSCTRLRYIDLACCPHLTDMSVFELASNLPKLRRIGLVKVVNLTDQAIYSLVERHTSLERIHLSYCENISVPAIFWLLQRLTRLTHLSLTGVPAFRRQELQQMCRPPPNDFNEHQRQAFCVFSGKGVNELRRYLQEVYSDEQQAAQFGPLAPDVRRAFATMVEEGVGPNGQQSRHHSTGHRTRAASDIPTRSTGLDPRALGGLALDGGASNVEGRATGATELSAADQLYYQQQMQLARYVHARRAAAEGDWQPSSRHREAATEGNALQGYLAQHRLHRQQQEQQQHPLSQEEVQQRLEDATARYHAEQAYRESRNARMRTQQALLNGAANGHHQGGPPDADDPPDESMASTPTFPQTRTLARAAPSTERRIDNNDGAPWSPALPGSDAPM